MDENGYPEIDQEEDYEIRTDYTTTDVAGVINQVNFHFWGEVVDWLRKHAAAETELTPRQVNLMIRDFQKLSNEGVPFTNSAEEAERLAKEYRND